MLIVPISLALALPAPQVSFCQAKRAGPGPAYALRESQEDSTIAELAVKLTAGTEENSRLLQGIAAIRRVDAEAGQLFRDWFAEGTARYPLPPDAFAEMLVKSSSLARRGWAGPEFFYSRRALRSCLNELDSERGLLLVSARITHVLEKTANVLTQSPITPKWLRTTFGN